MVGYGLQEIASHLGVEIGHQAVRQVVVSRYKDLVGVRKRSEQGVDGGTGSFGRLGKAGVSQPQAFTGDRSGTQDGDAQ